MIHRFNTAIGKQSLYCVLLIQDKQLTPEAKYLLMRILWLYGEADIPITLLEWIETLGLSEAVLRKARDLLLELGYLQESKGEVCSQKNVGRPRKLLKVTDECVKKIEKAFLASEEWLCQRYDEHLLRIDYLLFWPIEGDTLRKQNYKKLKKNGADATCRHTFTAATRILLAVLYLHADRYGVVRNLSSVKLSTLTGMSLDRLESQFAIITDLGYLMSRVSGLTNKKLFGHAKSIFFLNIFTDGLVTSNTTSLFLAFDMKILNDYNDFSWAYRIRQWLFSPNKKFVHVPHRNANQVADFVNTQLGGDYFEKDKTDWADNLPQLLVGIRKLLVTKGLYFKRDNKGFTNTKDFYLFNTNPELIFEWLTLFEPFKLDECFDGGLTAHFFKYLQVKLDEYASELLSAVFIQFNGDDCYNMMYIDQRLSDRIRADLFPSIKSVELIVSDTQSSALLLFIYCIAYQHALALKGLIDVIFPSSSDHYSLSVLPNNHVNNFRTARYLIVSISSVNPLLAGNCHVINRVKDPTQELELKSYAVEELNAEQRQLLFEECGYDLNKLIARSNNQ